MRLWDTSSMCNDSSRQGLPQSEREVPPCVPVLRAHSAVFYGVALSSDGRWFASCSFDRTIRLWDTAAVLNRDKEDEGDRGDSDASHFVIGNEYGREAWSVALSADGGLLVSGRGDGAVRLWREGKGTILRAERPYERMRTGGLTGITEAQRASLVALGAI